MTFIGIFDRECAHRVADYLRENTVRVHFVYDPRVKVGSYFEELEDGSYYCHAGHVQLTSLSSAPMLDFLIREYPA